MTEEYAGPRKPCDLVHGGDECAAVNEGYWGDDEEEIAFVKRWNCDPKTLGAYGEDGCLVFVEVKTRAGGDKGFPQEAVTPTKRARYERIAYSFLSTYDGVDARVRFDVIAIQAMPNSRGFVKHIVNAFGAGA